jgi:nitric oxide reductase subunit B
LGYISQPGNVILEWLRMPGDVIFIVGGILPFLWITWLGIRYGVKATTHVVPPETLFVEEHPEAEEDRTGVPLGVIASGSRVAGSQHRYGSDRRAPDRDDDRREGRDP